ncbi:MAG: Mrp/NBP35 family ATP-binding protein [Ignavibacteriae bacterium]|nr:Mrp/NBP35 family ATP-binding protein [Ignavibacteriota bacterium]
MNTRENTKSYQEVERRIKETIFKIKHRIAVFSGKGGVGKTTISVNLAYALKSLGSATGILDADVTGPNVAKMLNVYGDLIYMDEVIIPFEKYGVKMISAASILGKGQPLIWHGPLRSKLINQFLADVDWGVLDYLIADLPPGTGDEIITIGQEMKPDFAVIVTTPQQVSVIDAERAINMAKQLSIPHIGIIENMSGFICPHCSAEIDIFGFGGGRKLAEENDVHFLGSIPIDIQARILGDKGEPIVHEKPDCEVSKAIIDIALKIDLLLNENKSIN